MRSFSVYARFFHCLLFWFFKLSISRHSRAIVIWDIIDLLENFSSAYYRHFFRFFSKKSATAKCKVSICCSLLSTSTWLHIVLAHYVTCLNVSLVAVHIFEYMILQALDELVSSLITSSANNVTLKTTLTIGCQHSQLFQFDLPHARQLRCAK